MINSATGVLGLCGCCLDTSTLNRGKYHHAPYLRRPSIRSIRSVRSGGAGRRSRDSIHRTGSQADIQQEPRNRRVLRIQDSLSHDLIHQAELANYRGQIEPTIKTIIAEIDDIEPHFQKVADLFVCDRWGEKGEVEIVQVEDWGLKWCCRHWYGRCYLRMTSRRRWRVCASSRRSYQRFMQAISPSERSSSHVCP